MLAGFTAASMVFTHLAAACMGPIFVGYAYIFLARAKPHMTVAQRMRLPMTAMLWGGLICQIIYGTYLSVVYDYFFVFLFEQLHLAVNEAVFMTGSLPLTFLATSATWLTIHGVALVGCVIALVVSLVRGKSLLDFDVFWFACVSVLFGGLLVFEVLHWSYFLGREGLYASFLLIPSYLAIGALLFGLAGTDWRLAILTAAVFLVSIAYRLVHDGAPPAFLPNPVIGLAAMGGIAVVMPLLFANRRVRVGALLALAVILSLSPWKFIDDTSIRATSRLIRQMTGDRTPRIFFAGDDKVGTGPLRSIVATFTERAWGRHGEFYPDFSKNAWAPIFDFQDKDVVVVLSSSISDVNVPREALARYVAEASILGSFKVNRPDAPIWAHIFQIRPRQR